MGRTVVSFTTIPSRLEAGLLDKVLNSLSNQTVQPDAVYLSAPQESCKGKPYDETALEELKTRHPGLTILRPPKDLGPITKLIPVLDVEPDPTTNLILVDDDVSYHPGMIENLLKYQELKAVGTAGRRQINCGVCYLIYQGDFSSISRTTFLETFAGVLYSRSLFPSTSVMSSWVSRLPENCFFNDDLVIGAWVAKQQGMYLIPKGPYSSVHDPGSTEQLSSENLTGRLGKAFNEMKQLGWFGKDSPGHNTSYCPWYVILGIAVVVIILVAVIWATVRYVRRRRTDLKNKTSLSHHVSFVELQGKKSGGRE